MRLGISNPHFTGTRITLENDVTGPSEGIEERFVAATTSEGSQLGQV